MDWTGAGSVGDGSPPMSAQPVDLEGVLAAELAGGNAIESRGRDECDRDVVRLARPFGAEWGRIVDAPATAWRIEQGGREILEDEAHVVNAPAPSPEHRARRVDAALRDGRLRPETESLPREIPRGSLLARCAGAIERDLRAAGVWRTDAIEPPPFQAAFGADVMPFTDWLQLVFLPRLRAVALANAPLPGAGVAAYAVRELDGHTDLAPLVARLSWLDHLAGNDAAIATRPARGTLAAVGLGTIVVFAVAMFGAAAIAFAVGGWLAAHWEASSPSRGASESMADLEARGLRSLPDASLELRLKAEDDASGASRASRLELKRLTFKPFRPPVPGQLPLAVSCAEPLDVPAIEAWLVAQGAQAPQAGSDAARLADYARALGQAADVRDPCALAPAGLAVTAIGKPTRYAPPRSEAPGLVIRLGVLLGFLIPTMWWCMRRARPRPIP